LTLTPRERAVSEGAPITGRVRLGCPAMPPTLPANLVTVTNSDQPLGPTVVELRRPNFNQTEGLILNQELDIPDSIIVPPGMVEATFQITAPEHFPKFLQGWLHPPSVEAGITADLRRGSGGYASQSARFVYPRLGEVTLSGPVVGSRTVAGTVTLTQPTPMTEQVCFHVRDAGGRLAGASGHRFTVTSSGSTVPNCVDIPAGRTSGSFQVSAEVRTPVAYTLEGVRRHRHADGTLPVIDSAGTPIHAWPVPVVERVTVRQPPSSSVPPNPVVNVEKNGQVNGYVVLVNPAPPGGVTVDLLCKSSNPAGERLCGETVSLPERVTVREGVREAAFPIGVSRSSVEGSVMVMTSLEGREVGGPLYLELPPAFTLLDLVPAGQSNYRTLTIHLDGPVRAEPIQIALEVSGEGAAFLNVPATVVIPLGETMINVSVPVTRPVTKPLETTLTAVRVESKDMISATVVLQP
ncbi:MAG: hypothetical protein OEZ37_03970, partial [Gemmatimonadota bacterium]|nr:hypothetical protein [Gemmatimonadota bacterium]